MRTIALIALVAFALGLVLMGWLADRSGFDLTRILSGGAQVETAVQDPATTQAAEPTADAEPTPDVTASASRAARDVALVAQAQGGLDQRLAGLEQRITRLDLQAQAAAGNAARAEGLLIAFATRRAVERGAPLGYLADQLRLRFGDAMPNAVRTVIAFSERPVTLDELIARLEGLEPRLAAVPKDEGVWNRLSRELDQLFVIRRESVPSPQPERRIARARLFLESGRIEAAIAEVRNTPGAGDARGWIRDAQRYASAQNSLDLIETAAVLEPRRLNDGSGTRVEQLSPVAGDTGQAAGEGSVALPQ